MSNEQILDRMERAVLAWGDETIRIRRIEEQRFCAARGWRGPLKASQYAEMNAVVDPIILNSDASRNFASAQKVLREFQRYCELCKAC